MVFLKLLFTSRFVLRVSTRLKFNIFHLRVIFPQNSRFHSLLPLLFRGLHCYQLHGNRVVLLLVVIAAIQFLPGLFYPHIGPYILLVLPELGHEAIIRMDDLPALFDMSIGLFVSHVVLANEVGENHGNRTTDSSNAVNKHIGLLEGFVYEVSSSVEVGVNLAGLLVVKGVVFVHQEVLDGYVGVVASGACHHCLDVVFCITKGVLLRVMGFSAASTFDM